MRILKRTTSIFAALLASFLLLLTGLILWAFWVYPTAYVSRVLTMRMSSVEDYLVNFPTRPLQAAEVPFEFGEALAEEMVLTQFSQLVGAPDFEAWLADRGTQAFLVIQHDAILYEGYFNGADPTSMMTSFSVAKSFTSALVGMAIAEGHISSIDDPITRYLPELSQRDPRFEQISIRHLLLMASGLVYQDFRPGLFNSDDPLTTYHPDQRWLALNNTRIQEQPGVHFKYNKYHPQLLGMIIERATGYSVTEYTQTRLWNPLGMEFDGAWALDSEASGFEKMEAGLNARAIDFAKFGRLYLNNGEWMGKQLLPDQWIADSTQPMWSVYQSERGYYGYMWWGFYRADAPADFSAVGDHGQFIYVSPARDLIIVRNGTEWGFPGDDGAAMEEWTKLIHDFISKLER